MFLTISNEYITTNSRKKKFIMYPNQILICRDIYNLVFNLVELLMYVKKEIFNRI